MKYAVRFFLIFDTENTEEKCITQFACNMANITHDEAEKISGVIIPSIEAHYNAFPEGSETFDKILTVSRIPADLPSEVLACIAKGHDWEQGGDDLNHWARCKRCGLTDEEE